MTNRAEAERHVLESLQGAADLVGASAALLRVAGYPATVVGWVEDVQNNIDSIRRYITTTRNERITG